MVERDIYEVANQLGSYIDEETPAPLATFLRRESREAAKLAARIAELAAENERLRQSASDADIVAKHFQSERDHLQECLEDVLEQMALSRTGAVEVTEAMVEAGLEYYAEGGCGGLADYERREVVEAIIEAALKAAMEAGR